MIGVPGMPGADPEVILREYLPQLSAGEELLATIWGTAPRSPANEAHMVVMNVLGRSISTYRAVLRLLRHGFWEQAWMLNRSLFEDLIFGYWVALPDHRNSASKLISEHNDRTNARIDEILAETRAGKAGIEATTWKGRSLAGSGIEKMTREVEPLWETCGGNVVELRQHLEITNWISNLSMHASGSALQQTLRRGSVKVARDTYLYGYGQTAKVEEARMTHAFASAAFRIGWLARLALIEAGQSLEELEKAYARVIDASNNLMPARLRGWGRNDPCWCGSQEKTKRCNHPAVRALAES